MGKCDLKKIQTKDQVRKKSQRDKSKWNRPNRVLSELDSILWEGRMSVWLGVVDMLESSDQPLTSLSHCILRAALLAPVVAACVPQGSACLHLPRPVVTGTLHCIRLLMCKLGIQVRNSCLCGEHFTQ